MSPDPTRKADQQAARTAGLSAPAESPFTSALARVAPGIFVLLWATGLWRFLQVGAASAPPGWHAMAGIAAVMTVIFGVIAHGIFPKVRAAAADQRFPDAAAGLGRIRTLVAVNLALGIATAQPQGRDHGSPEHGGR